MNLTDRSRNPPLAARASTHKLNLVTCELNQRVFLLSPAYAGGERARMVMSEHAQFDLARRLRSKRGATIAEVFSFLSGLYFRGKIAYANAFAGTTSRDCGVFVITPTRGLVDARSRITLSDLHEFAA